MDQPFMGADEHPAMAAVSRMKTIETECSSPYYKRWNTANDPAEMITPPQTPPEMSMDALKVCIQSVFLRAFIAYNLFYIIHNGNICSTQIWKVVIFAWM